MWYDSGNQAHEPRPARKKGVALADSVATKLPKLIDRMWRGCLIRGLKLELRKKKLHAKASLNNANTSAVPLVGFIFQVII